MINCYDSDRDERRQYALLQAAATLMAAGRSINDAAALASFLLDAIEKDNNVSSEVKPSNTPTPGDSGSWLYADEEPLL